MELMGSSREMKFGKRDKGCWFCNEVKILQ